jgi:hypothetical protein
VGVIDAENPVSCNVVDVVENEVVVEAYTT